MQPTIVLPSGAQLPQQQTSNLYGANPAARTLLISRMPFCRMAISYRICGGIFIHYKDHGSKVIATQSTDTFFCLRSCPSNSVLQSKRHKVHMDYIVPCLKFLTMSPFSHNHKASTASEQKHFPFVNMLKPDFFFCIIKESKVRS